MLRPFKSFLNNLQKNAETFFGSKSNSPEMNPEEEEEIATDSMYNIDELDPLGDPLALDDEIGDRTLDAGVGSVYASRNSTLSDLDSSDDGQIILVDVNTLKNAFTIPVSYADTALDIVSSSHTTDIDALSLETNGEPTLLEVNVSADDGIGEVTFEPIALSLDDEIIEEVEGARSDGSDSGLGLELCAGLLPEKSNVSQIATTPQPTRSNLKRRSDSHDQIDEVDAKKPKRNIQFNGVTVYYFPRIQGFTCVPSQGGCTLGMSPKHCEQKSFSLSEHMAEQKRIHRQQMLDRSPRPPSSLSNHSSVNAILNSAPISLSVPTSSGTLSITSSVSQSANDDRSQSSTEESDSEEDILSDNSSSELDTETIGFLQPVSQRQRRALLKAAGVEEIASSEKNECRDIRASREFCGCSCRDYCDPETCFCSQSGIKCQVDRASFPCGCTQDGCGNVIGRVEFNPKRVRTHFIHTIMRLEMEKKQKKSDKQNTLNTYDGRLRLRESDDDAVDSPNMNSHQSSSLGRLITYNPSNNLLYPTASNQSSSGVVSAHLSGSNNPYGSSDDPSRNCSTSLAVSPLDLHYEFRNDYAVDMTPSDINTQSSYPTLYASSSYYPTTSAFDFSAMNASNQSSIIPSFSAYSTNIPYNGLLNSTASSSCSVDGASSTSSSLHQYNSASSDCVNLNGSLFDSQDDLLPTLSSHHQSTAHDPKANKSIEQYSEKFSEYEVDSNKLLDVAAADLNCLLSENNLSTPQIDQVPSSTGNNDDNVSNSENVSTATESYVKYQSDYANKLHMAQNYELSTDAQTKSNHEIAENHYTNSTINVDKSSDIFEKDPVLAN